ncbi:MAG: hypothetical protein IH885_04555 [Myxococcales bacterium]|nr:hypothetical protein [Myxococcales bacterium]
MGRSRRFRIRYVLAAVGMIAGCAVLVGVAPSLREVLNRLDALEAELIEINGRVVNLEANAPVVEDLVTRVEAIEQGLAPSSPALIPIDLIPVSAMMRTGVQFGRLEDEITAIGVGSAAATLDFILSDSEGTLRAAGLAIASVDVVGNTISFEQSGDFEFAENVGSSVVPFGLNGTVVVDLEVPYMGSRSTLVLVRFVQTSEGLGLFSFVGSPRMNQSIQVFSPVLGGDELWSSMGFGDIEVLRLIAGETARITFGGIGSSVKAPGGEDGAFNHSFEIQMLVIGPLE